MITLPARTSDDTDRGASMVEYALLVALIAVVALVAIVLAGESISTTFSNIADSLTAA